MQDRAALFEVLFPEAMIDGVLDPAALARALEATRDGDPASGGDAPNGAGALLDLPGAGRSAAGRAEATAPLPHLHIEGDNLDVMRALLPDWAGRVDRIYADPPYNTGRATFVYDDNRSRAAWLEMMAPRLRLARDLLAPTGWIFLSIDDNEAAALRLLMDQIFGRENFLAWMTWRGMHTVRNSSRHFNRNSEFVLCYARDAATAFSGDRSTWLRQPVDKSGRYPRDDGDGKGPYKLDPLHARNPYRRFTHTFENGVSWSAPDGRYPAYSPETLRRLEADGELDFRGAEPRIKRYLRRVAPGRPPDTLLPNELTGFNKDGTGELAAIFGRKVFDQPKPTALLRHLLGFCRAADADRGELVVMDFFAGSGSTGDAVIQMNRAGASPRMRFVGIQIPAETDDPEWPTLAEIGRERLRRVLDGDPARGPDAEGLRCLRWSPCGGDDAVAPDSLLDGEAPSGGA